MSNNIILSAAVGYKFEQIELFIKSLRKYYSDKICFIISKNDQILVDKLKTHRCDFILSDISKKEIQFERYNIYLKYLKNKTFNQILLCDCRDIVFQGNPFNYNYKGSINFFLEDFKIKDCQHNRNWIVKTYGQKELESISHKTILCSGTVLGNNKKITEYLKLICKNISTFKYKKKLKYLITFRIDPESRGCDQGHANYIVHKSIIENVNLYSNSKGPVATVFYLKKIKFDNNSKLINEIGEPYLIVHQYDKRWSEFSNAINYIKKQLGIRSFL